MKVLITVLLVGVAGLAAAAEVMAPRLVEDRVEQRVRENSREAAAVEADAGTFPFVPRLLMDTEVRRLAVTLTEIAGQELTLTAVTYELEGIHLDRDALFEGEVEVTDIDTGTATLTISREELAAVADVVPDEVEVDGRTISLAPAGVAGPQMAVPPELLPCEPQAETSEEELRLSCVFQEVPAVLVRSAG